MVLGLGGSSGFGEGPKFILRAWGLPPQGGIRQAKMRPTIVSGCSRKTRDSRNLQTLALTNVFQLCMKCIVVI